MTMGQQIARHRGLWHELVRRGAGDRLGRRAALTALVSMASMAVACRDDGARARVDTMPPAARGTATAAATTPPTRDTSAGTVAMSSAPTETAVAGTRDTSSRPAAAAAAPVRAATGGTQLRQRDTTNEPRSAPRRAGDTTARPRAESAATGKAATKDSGAARATRPAPTAGRESTAVARESTTARRDTTPSPARGGQEPAPAQPPAAQQPGAQTGDKLAVTQSEYNGWKTFAVNCTRCHGEDAVGSTIAPSLIKSLREHVTHDVFVQTVTDGRPDKGMPTWGPLLSKQQIEDLYAYVKARSDGRLAPGRPHVKAGS